jgi:hypothetical protein
MVRHLVRPDVIALAVAAVAGSAAAEAFDLHCGDTRYRIDLAAKTWCSDECDHVSGLMLGRRGYVFLISMADFALYYDNRSRRMIWGGEKPRRCRKAKFSGFPPASRLPQ